ncbi:MAG: hypothetical protein K2Y39_19150 [Candidatus Obscuribacterales bacterium]|nr:hypothetical protein [Candidatus Obscuribacterales bacterium]
MTQQNKIPLAALTALILFSLAPAAPAGNEPAHPTTPATAPQKQVPVMDRPEMASFKRIQVNAMKYRQKLSNLGTILEQSKRVNAVTEPNYKKLKTDLDHLLENEPAMARNGWKDSDIAEFDKQVEAYKAKFEKLTLKDEEMPKIPESILKGIKASPTSSKTQAKPATENKTIPQKK